MVRLPNTPFGSVHVRGVNIFKLKAIFYVLSWMTGQKCLMRATYPPRTDGVSQRGKEGNTCATVPFDLVYIDFIPGILSLRWLPKRERGPSLSLKRRLETYRNVFRILPCTRKCGTPNRDFSIALPSHVDVCRLVSLAMFFFLSSMYICYLKLRYI